MLDHELYTRERLRDLDYERLMLLSERPAARRRAPVIGPAIRRTGRMLKRLGEGLEMWATREPEAPRLDCPS